jgi:predicted dehydrogenase
MPDTFRFLIDARIPFVMEKPWGIDPDTVAELAYLAAEKGAWVSVWAVTVKRMIADGEFGRISHIVYRGIRPTMNRYVEWDSPWMADKSQSGGGALLNLGGHGFDMARFLIDLRRIGVSRWRKVTRASPRMATSSRPLHGIAPL